MKILKAGMVIALCLWASVGWAGEKTASWMEDYDLSERCGKQAESVFKIMSRLKSGETPIPGVVYETSDSPSQYVSFSFENHYNRRMNRCFVKIETTHSNKDSKNNARRITGSEIYLYDANEHTTLGAYWGDYLGIEKEKPFTCFVGLITNCDSHDSWRMLILPYMEE